MYHDWDLASKIQRLIFLKEENHHGRLTPELVKWTHTYINGLQSHWETFPPKPNLSQAKSTLWVGKFGTLYGKDKQ